MDFSNLHTTKADEEGTKFVPMHPDKVSGKLPFHIIMRSENSAKAIALSRAYAVRAMTSKEYRVTGMPDLDESIESVTKKLVCCTVSWFDEELKEPVFVLQGERLACTPENVKKVFSDPGLKWLREDALAYIKDDANFLPKGAPVSTTTPSASSSSVALSTPRSQSSAL